MVSNYNFSINLVVILGDKYLNKYYFAVSDINLQSFLVKLIDRYKIIRNGVNDFIRFSLILEFHREY